jgi:hypothetical protein
MALAFALGSHIFACLWIFLGQSRAGQNYDSSENWIFADGCGGGLDTRGLEHECTYYRLYIRAYYWAINTMVTIGLGDIIPHNQAESVLAMACQLSGALLSCCTVSGFASLVANKNLPKLAHDSNANSMKVLFSLFSRPIHHLCCCLICASCVF